MYLVISILTFIVSCKLFKKAAGGSLSLTRLNMISWIFYYNIVIQSFIAAILVVYHLDHHYFISKINSETSRVYGFYAIMYTAVSLPLGMILCNKVLIGRTTNTFFNTYIKKALSFQFTVNDSSVRFVLSVVAIICILSVIYVFISIRTFPLFTVITGSGNVDNLKYIRNEVGRGFDGIVYIKNFFALKLMPLISYIYYLYYRQRKESSRTFWFIITFIFSCLILTYNLEKSPILEYFIGFFFIKVLLGDKINYKKVFRLGISVLLSVIFIYIVILNHSVIELLSYNTGFVGRLILGQSAGTFLSFDLFPQNRHFLGFGSISAVVSGILDLPHFERSARMIMEFYNPTGIDLGTAGVSNSLFVSEAWANFGFMGVVLSPLYVGFITQFINLFCLKQKKTPIFLGLLAFLSYNIPITGGLNDFIYNPIYFLIFITIFLLISLSRIVYYKTN